MPKHEVGRKVFLLGLAAIAAAVLVALVWLDAKDLARYFIDGLFRLHAAPVMEITAS